MKYSSSINVFFSGVTKLLYLIYFHFKLIIIIIISIRTTSRNRQMNPLNVILAALIGLIAITGAFEIKVREELDRFLAENEVAYMYFGESEADAQFSLFAALVGKDLNSKYAHTFSQELAAGLSL